MIKMNKIIFAIIAVIFLIGCLPLEKTYPINFGSKSETNYTDEYYYKQFLNCSTYNSSFEFEGNGIIFINESLQPTLLQISYYNYNSMYTNNTFYLTLKSYKIKWDYFNAHICCNNKTIIIKLFE